MSSPQTVSYASKVKLFEGLDRKAFSKLLTDLKSSEASKLIGIFDYFSGSDPEGSPSVIDAGFEAYDLADYFADMNEGLKKIVTIPMSHADVDAYGINYLVPHYSQPQQFYALLRKHGVCGGKQELCLLARDLGVRFVAQFKSMQVFQDLSGHLLRENPQIATSKKLNILYPGSGYHLAPLATAMELIQKDQIDSAHYVLTEIDDEEFEEHVSFVLKKGVEKGIFRSVQETPPQLSHGGWERRIQIDYRGKSIEMIYAIRQSGDKYYRPEMLAQADLVVIHDPQSGPYPDSVSLMADILKTRAEIGLNNSQYVIIEGASTSIYSGSRYYSELNLPFTPVYISGAYGHCQYYPGIGEMGTCLRSGAEMFPLNHPLMREMVSFSPNRDALIHNFLKKDDYDFGEPTVVR